MSTTVRVSSETHQRLVTLAEASGRRIQDLVDDAITAYEADQFWTAFDAGYSLLAADPEQWAEIQTERSREASALGDHIAES